MSARTALGKEGTEPGHYTDIGDALRNLSPNPGDDLRELWLRMIFGILVTNTDDHLKNHGLLRDANGSWRLSPVFDVNPQPRRQPGMETGISPIHGFEPSVPAAIDAAPLFDVDEVEARTLARDAAEKIRNEWRNALRRHGLAGSAISACAPAFEHERSDAALSL
jgi:serine/threonine-protein kinase HipA